MSERLEVKLVRMPGRWVLMLGREVVAAFANRSEALAALRAYRGGGGVSPRHGTRWDRRRGRARWCSHQFHFFGRRPPWLTT